MAAAILAAIAVFIFSWIIIYIVTITFYLVLKYTKLKNEIKNYPFWDGCLKTLTNFSFSGRASRIEYVNFQIMLSIINFFLFPVLMYYFIINKSGFTIFSIIAILLVLWIVISGFAVSVRRWHDMNKTFWICFGINFAANMIQTIFKDVIKLPAVTGLLSILTLIVCAGLGIYTAITKGTEGDNNYGEEPTECIDNPDKYEYVYVEEEVD